MGDRYIITGVQIEQLMTYAEAGEEYSKGWKSHKFKTEIIEGLKVQFISALKDGDFLDKVKLGEEKNEMKRVVKYVIPKINL